MSFPKSVEAAVRIGLTWRPDSDLSLADRVDRALRRSSAVPCNGPVLPLVRRWGRVLERRVDGAVRCPLSERAAWPPIAGLRVRKMLVCQ